MQTAAPSRSIWACGRVPVRWVAVAPSTLILFFGAAVLLGASPRLEPRSRSPLMSGSALRNHTKVASGLVMFLFRLGLFIFPASLLSTQC